MSIESKLGGGPHRHLFLTITAADFLAQNGSPYATQVSPGVCPIHQANITGPNIVETNHQLEEDQH